MTRPSIVASLKVLKRSDLNKTVDMIFVCCAIIQKLHDRWRCKCDSYEERLSLPKK